MLGPIGMTGRDMKLIAYLKSKNAILRRQLLKNVVRHVPRDVDHVAHPIVRRNYRMETGIDRLQCRFRRSMRDVDYHPQQIHLMDHLSSMRCESIPLRFRATGIGIILIPVMRRELSRPNAQPVHLVHHAQVTIQIVAALNIQDRRHLSFGSNSLDVSGIEGELYLIAILLQLFKCIVNPAERLLRLKTIRIVLLRYIARQEEGAHASLLRPWQIPISVIFARAHAAALVELTIQSVNVPIKDKGAFM